MEEKKILAEVIINYEELRRILKKTEYEIYLGELKSKLNNLYFKRNLSESFGGISPARVSSIGRVSSIDREISELEKELRNTKNTVKVSEEIQDRVFFLFKNYINKNKEFDLRKEADETNTLITKNILQTLESSIKYHLKKIENRISKGRLYLAQMKDSQRKYDKIIEKLEDTKNKNNIEMKKNLEETYDKTLETIYEADLAIKDSKVLRLVFYFGLLFSILTLILTLILSLPQLL